MPSDPRLAIALTALTQPIAEFRAIVEGAITQAELLLADQDATAAQRSARAAVSLGRFAEGRIDTARFAAIFPAVAPLSATAIAALHRALDVLRGVQVRGDDLFVVDVPSGTRMSAALDAALGHVSQAFGAAVLAEFIRGGRYEEAHDQLLDAQPFRAWNKAERRFAPPLVVMVDGADVQSGALMDYADGRAKLVLLVRGGAPPAPLARCITPGTFVLQTIDGSGLDRVAAFGGPAVAAMMPEGAAVFMHDPALGREPWQRLTVTHMPEPPKRALGGQSAWQMTQDLRVLADLATTPFAVPTSTGGAAPAVGADDATARIAAWLLAQAAPAEGAP